MSKQDRKDRSASPGLNTTMPTTDKSSQDRREALRKIAKRQAAEKQKDADKPKEEGQ